MSRNYQYLDSDEERLPEGMQRIGYDADSSRYTFRDSDGSLRQSEEGSRYGVLRPLGSKDEPMTLEQQQAMAENNKASWRYLLPFFLLCAVFLLGVFKLLDSGSKDTVGMHPGQGQGHPHTASINCPEGAEKYDAVKEDTCWDIAEYRKTSVEALMLLNEENGLDCNRLEVGKRLCVPGVTAEIAP